MKSLNRQIFEILDDVGDFQTPKMHVIDGDDTKRVYHSNGFCVVVKREMIFEVDNVSDYLLDCDLSDVDDDGYYYSVNDEAFYGFKPISSQDLFNLLKKEIRRTYETI